MQVIATTGKGGVGKSTVSGALALYLAQTGNKTIWVDHDKEGAAIDRVYSPQENMVSPKNEIFNIAYKDGRTIDNLLGAGIAPLKFNSIEPKKKRSDVEWNEYISQFDDGMGMVAFNDMGCEMQGFATFPEVLSELLNLAKIATEAVNQGVEYMVLDLEGTKGTRRLLQASLSAARSMQNMKHKMRGTFKSLGRGAVGQKDWDRFIYSDHVEFADEEADAFREAMVYIIEADYVLVCGPQKSKVDEMVNDILPMVDSKYKMHLPDIKMYAGQGHKVLEPNVAGCVVNMVRTDEDGNLFPIDARNIEFVNGVASDRGVGVVQIPENRDLEYSSDIAVLKSLEEVGRAVYQGLF